MLHQRNVCAVEHGNVDTAACCSCREKNKYCGVLLPVEDSEWSGHKIIQQKDVFP